jgi:MoaA/NifB/PqqE/SkfB family radical SAM enzyme
MPKFKRNNLPRLNRYFSAEDTREALENNKLLSLSIKLPVGCNLRCLYCYSERKYGNLSYDELLDILFQAAQMGIRSLSIVGEGEPLLYRDRKSGKDVFDLIRDANRMGLEVILYTNTTLINKKIAEVLYGLNVTVVGKLNSLHKDIQDFLCGVKGSFEKITKGLSHLEKAGFTKGKSRLSIHTVICKQNYSQIPQLWKEWRKRNIIPYVQVMIHPAKKNVKYFPELKVPPAKVRDLFHKLSIIDRKEFGFVWDPDYTYPIAALGCSVIKTGCCIDSSAKVQMCGCLQDNVGDLRKSSLREIINSARVRKIRLYNYNSGSVSHIYFYGCRTMAFNMTGDRFARDPFFWKNKNG